jgi:hypothetical protein
MLGEALGDLKEGSVHTSIMRAARRNSRTIIAILLAFNSLASLGVPAARADSPNSATTQIQGKYFHINVNVVNTTSNNGLKRGDQLLVYLNIVADAQSIPPLPSTFDDCRSQNWTNNTGYKPNCGSNEKTPCTIAPGPDPRFSGFPSNSYSGLDLNYEIYQNGILLAQSADQNQSTGRPYIDTMYFAKDGAAVGSAGENSSVRASTTSGFDLAEPISVVSQGTEPLSIKIPYYGSFIIAQVINDPYRNYVLAHNLGANGNDSCIDDMFSQFYVDASADRGGGLGGVSPGAYGYDQALPQATVGFTFIKQSQSITFLTPTSTPLDSQLLQLAATSSSGLPITYSSLTPKVCLPVGNTLTLLGPGNCGIQADQTGNENISAASSVMRYINVISTKTIVCTKGKVKKNLTALTPLCPKGFSLSSTKEILPKPIVVVNSAAVPAPTPTQTQSAPSHVLWNAPSDYTRFNSTIGYKWEQLSSCSGNPKATGQYSCGLISLYSTDSCPRITILSTFTSGNTTIDRPITYLNNYVAGTLVPVELDTADGKSSGSSGQVKVDNIYCG